MKQKQKKNMIILFTLIALVLIQPFASTNIVWNTPSKDVVFHPSSGNAYFYANTSLNLSTISISSTVFTINTTGFNVSSANRVNITIMELNDNPATGETAIKFYADCSAGTVWFNLSEYINGTKYNISRDSVFVETVTVSGGIISFNSAAWSSHLFNVTYSGVYNNSIMHWNISFKNSSVNKSIAHWNVSFKNTSAAINNSIFHWNASFRNSSAAIPPTITINFAGNLSDSGGPYWRPPGEITQLTGLWSDGYYTNNSRQQEDWMYINVTANASGSTITHVWLQWFNETTWTNWTYAFANTVGEYWEYNTSGNIQTCAGYNYSFNIVANSSGGSNTTWWNKTVYYGDVTARRYVQLNTTQVSLNYTIFYNYEADDNTYVTYKKDPMHHDQGTSANDDDSGYILLVTPTDTMNVVYCGTYLTYWFDESMCIFPTVIDNIYFHLWWDTDDDDLEYLGYLNTRSDAPATVFNETVSKIYASNAPSNVTYDFFNGITWWNLTYHLYAERFDLSIPQNFTDNSIYEFAVPKLRTMSGPLYTISNRSITSFVLFNVPDNATLNASHADTDGDGLSDWNELYINYTNPFLVDTDNDGVSDYHEYLSGSDPNNWTDTIPYCASNHSIFHWNMSFRNTTNGRSVFHWNISFKNSSTTSSMHVIRPLNESVDQRTLTECEIWANDTLGQTLTVWFEENTTGPGMWAMRQKNLTVPANSTVNWTHLQATNNNTNYWWRVTIWNGVVNITEVFWYKTANIVTQINLENLSPIHNVTWSHHVDNGAEGLWINKTGIRFETVILNITVNTSMRVTQIDFWANELSEGGNDLVAPRMTCYVSTDNVTFEPLQDNQYGFGYGVFPPGGGNLTWNSSTSPAGADPFMYYGNGSAITGNCHCYMRLRFNTSVTDSARHYTEKSTWYVYISNNSGGSSFIIDEDYISAFLNLQQTSLHWNASFSNTIFYQTIFHWNVSFHAHFIINYSIAHWNASFRNSSISINQSIMSWNISFKNTSIAGYQSTMHWNFAYRNSSLSNSTVITLEATGVEEINATLQGFLEDDGGETCRVGFEWGLNTSYGHTDFDLSLVSGQNPPANYSGNEFFKFPKDIWLYNSTVNGSNSCENFFEDIVGNTNSVFRYINGVIDTSWVPGCPFNDLEYIDNATDQPTYTYNIVMNNADTLNLTYDNLTAATGDDYNHQIAIVGGPFLYGLSPGTLYHYRAFATNSNSTVNGSGKVFLTKPFSPVNITAQQNSSTNNYFTWSSGAGRNRTILVRQIGSYPTISTDGTVVYNGTSTKYEDDSLTSGTLYRYRLWSFTHWSANNSWGDSSSDLNHTILTRPTDTYTPYFYANQTRINVTWTSGANANRSVIILKSSGFPTSSTDGTIVYNSSRNYMDYNITVGNKYHFSTYKYANWDNAGDNFSALSENITQQVRGEGWILQGGGYFINNVLYTTSKNLSFSHIIINSTTNITLNSTRFDITSANPVVIELEYLASNLNREGLVMEFNASSNSSLVVFNISGLAASRIYSLYVDDVFFSNLRTSSTGATEFNYNSFSKHNFAIFGAQNYTFFVRYENNSYGFVNLSRYGPHKIIIQYANSREENIIYGRNIIQNETAFSSYNFYNGTFNISVATIPLWAEIQWNATGETSSSETTERFYGYPKTQNTTTTYIQIANIPINLGSINVTCYNSTAPKTESYPNFVWDTFYTITIYPYQADEFNQINVTYTYTTTYSPNRCSRTQVIEHFDRNVTFWIYTNKNIYGESTTHFNGSLIRYTYDFEDKTGVFINQPDVSTYVYIYTYDPNGTLMIIHSEYWDSSDKMYPMLLYKKDYLLGISCPDLVIDEVGIAPTSSNLNPVIIIHQPTSQFYSIGDVIFIRQGWSVPPSGLYVYYQDTVNGINNVQFYLYNLSNFSLAHQSSSVALFHNFTYPTADQNHTYYWQMIINHSYWTDNQTISGVIFAINASFVDASYLDAIINMTLGYTPFRNVDTGQEVPWVYVLIFAIFFALLVSFAIINAYGASLISGLWLMFSGMYFYNLPSVGLLGGALLVTAGSFLAIIAILAALGGFGQK